MADYSDNFTKVSGTRYAEIKNILDEHEIGYTTFPHEGEEGTTSRSFTVDADLATVKRLIGEPEESSTGDKLGYAAFYDVASVNVLPDCIFSVVNGMLREPTSIFQK